MTPDEIREALELGGCPCWVEVVAHPSHCCFADDADPTQPLPCGHEPESVFIRMTHDPLPGMEAL